MHQKARCLALAEAPIQVFLCCIVLTKALKSVKVCLECPDFNALGAAVCCPQNHLPDAGPGDALKGACRLGLGGEAPILFSLSYHVGKTLKLCECLLGMPSFQCIGGGSVPPPITCRTLGRAVHQKARCLALAEAPMYIFCVTYHVGKM